MKLLLDTHLLLWVAGQPKKLSRTARKLLGDPGNALLFSVVSLWEIAIKQGLGRRDFQVRTALLRRGLVDNGYEELPLLGTHVNALANLPALHKDPFDRMLVAQSNAEEIPLLTADPLVAQYPGLLRQV